MQHIKEKTYMLALWDLMSFSGFTCLPQTLTLRSNRQHPLVTMHVCSFYFVRYNASLSLTVSPPEQPRWGSPSISSPLGQSELQTSFHLFRVPVLGCTASLSFQWPHQETRTVCLSVSGSSRPLYPSYYNTNLSFP